MATSSAASTTDVALYYRTKKKAVIERLLGDSSNFSVWHSQISAAFVIEGLEDILDNKLGGTTETSSTAAVTALATDTSETLTGSTPTTATATALTSADIKRRREAFGIIFGSCTPPIQGLLRGFIRGSRAQEAWNALTDLFDQTHRSRTFETRQEFNADVFDETRDSVQSRFNRRNDCQQELEGTVHAISEKDMIDKLCHGLPAVMGYYCEPAELQTSALKDLSILQRGEARVMPKKLETPAQALYAGKRGRKGFRREKKKNDKGTESSSNKAAKATGTCFTCKKLGHWSKECPLRKALENLKHADRSKPDELVQKAMAVAAVAQGQETTRASVNMASISVNK